MTDEQAALISACALYGGSDVGYATLKETAVSLMSVLEDLKWEKRAGSFD